MKKIIFIFLLICFSFLIFYRPILTSLAGWSLKMYSHLKWDKHFEYDAIALENYQLVIKQPKFCDESMFLAEDIAIHLIPKRIDHHFYFQIDIQKPQFHLPKQVMATFDHWVENLYRREHLWFKLYPHFRVNDGSIITQDGKLNFKLEMNKKKGGWIELFTNLDQQQHLFIQSFKTNQGVNWKIAFQSFDCKPIQTMTSFFESQGIPLTIHSGYLNGELLATLKKKRGFELEGHLTVEKLFFTIPGTTIEAKPQKINIAIKKRDEFHQADISIHSQNKKWHFLKIECKNKNHHCIEFDEDAAAFQDFLPEVFKQSFIDYFKKSHLFFAAELKMGEERKLIGKIKICEDKENLFHFDFNIESMAQKDLSSPWLSQGTFFLDHFYEKKSGLHFQNMTGNLFWSNLKTAVQGDKVMQDFELEPLTIGGEHSQKVKTLPIGSDYGSKDCVNLSPSTAVFRFKTNCQGVDLDGDIEIAYSDKHSDHVEVRMNCPHFAGKISDFKTILSSFNNEISLDRIPLEGEIVGRDKGLSLKYSFFSDHCFCKASIQASIQDACMTFQDSQLAMKGIFMNLDYDLEKELIQLSDIQGALLVGKPKKVEEFLVLGKKIEMMNLKKPSLALDVSIHHKQHELLRFVGQTVVDDVGTQELQLDKDLSHISAFVPTQWQCRFEDGFNLIHLNLNSDFDLEKVMQDVSLFKDSELIQLQKIFNIRPIQGKGSFSLDYLPKEGLFFNIQAATKNLDSDKDQQWIIKGVKYGEKIQIEKLLWNGYEANGELEIENDKWKIPFLELRLNRGGLFGLKGSLSCENDRLNLKFENAMAKFEEKSYEFKNTHLEVLDRQFYFSAHCQIENHPFQIEGYVDDEKSQGNLTLRPIDQSETLNVRFANQKTGLLEIEHIEGDFLGCHLQLTKENDHLNLETAVHGDKVMQDFELESITIGGEHSQKVKAPPIVSGYSSKDCVNLPPSTAVSRLKGEVSIDSKKINSWMERQGNEELKSFKLSSFLHLQGNFWINVNGEKNALDAISYKGKIFTQNMILKGYQMEHVEGDLQFMPGSCVLENLMVKDPAGEINSKKALFTVDSLEKWRFSIPQLSFRNINVGRLKTPGSQNELPKSNLILKKLDFLKVTGLLEEPKSWKGEGFLQFTHSSKKNVSHPFFAIPKEFILRLGLNPEVLNPIAGTIFFKLEGDHLTLNRFKDVYSEGKGSKFYLVGPEPSWIDLDGNLSINLKMKQYNILFKITDFFKFSIHGNIQKPLFSLHKQKR